jgi:hypothetical protein
MTHQIPTKTPPEHKSLTQSFFSWLNSHTYLFIGHLATIISFLILITSLIYYSLHTQHWLAEFITPLLLQDIIFWVHVAFITFCIFYLLWIIDVNEIEKDRVKEAREVVFGGNIRRRAMTLKRSENLLKEFKLYFLLFWISMLALYLTFMFINVQKQKDRNEKYVAIFSPHNNIVGTVSRKGGTGEEDKNVLVNVSEYKIDVALVSSEKDTSNLEKEKAASATEGGQPTAKYKQIEPFKTTSWYDAFKHIFPEFLPFAFNTISLMFVFWCLSIMYLPYQTKKEKLGQRRMLYLSGFVVFLLIMSYPLLFESARRGGYFTEESLVEYTTIFNAVSGTLNAVVVALLIARLDSKLIGLPSWLVSVLYLYAAVQPLFVVFSQPGLVNEIIKTVVLLFVFILKVYFFLIIIYAMQSGRMLNYLFCFPTLNQRIKSMFDNHFEVAIQEEHANKFHFIIKKHRSTLYTAAHNYHSRETCIADIERLKKHASNEGSYSIKPLGNTFIIEIKDTNSKKIHCSSLAQPSRANAEVLIKESIEYIPYCRRNESQ